MKVVALALGMLRRQRGDGQGEGIERAEGRWSHSLLQASPSVDWAGNKERSSLCDNTMVTGAVAKSLNGLPSGLCGVIWLGLSLLWYSALLLPQRAPHSNANCPFTVQAHGGFEGRLSREKFLLGDQVSLIPAHSSMNFL